MNELKFFIDFDGTITTQDVIDTILEKFTGPEWKITEEKWAKGLIGSRECLSSQLSLVKASQREFEALVDTIQVDPYFKTFLEEAIQMQIPVAVVSDGLDMVIHRVFDRTLTAKQRSLVRVYANRLSWDNGTARIGFPEGPLCEHACANCKERLIQKLSGRHDTVVFIGDGLSDRFAAKTANLTFAKNRLLTFCKDSNLPHKPYENFSQVLDWLRQQSSIIPK